MTDDIEHVLVGATGAFACALLRRRARDRAEVVEQFSRAWRKGTPPRVERVYRVIPPPDVRERFET